MAKEKYVHYSQSCAREEERSPRFTMDKTESTWRLTSIYMTDAGPVFTSFITESATEHGTSWPDVIHLGKAQDQLAVGDNAGDLTPEGKKYCQDHGLPETYGALAEQADKLMKAFGIATHMEPILISLPRDWKVTAEPKVPVPNL